MSETASERGPRRPGRLRAAWLALMGQPVVPDQLRAEWASWAIELEDLADKVAKGAAKLLQRDRRELEAVTKERDELRAQLEQEDPYGLMSGSGTYPDAKRMLNRRALALRGRTVPGVPMNGGGFDESGAETE